MCRLRNLILGIAAVVILAMLIAICTTSRKHSPKKPSPPPSPPPPPHIPCYYDPDNENTCHGERHALQHNFYQQSCPEAEQIIRSKLQSLYQQQKSVAPALVRLVFHDCFIGGCDASVLLNGSVGIQSEKDVIPNLTLKGFDTIDSIKERLEEVCPATVSCADTLVLAAREALVLLGAPNYYLPTGRRDSMSSYAEAALNELPNPNADLLNFLPKFADRGFNAKETVALLGAHNFGVIHCSFVQQRLYNFTQSASGGYDPTINPEFFAELTTRCPNVNSLPEEARLDMASSDSERLGNHYYDTVSQGRGILHADQELMSLEDTANWVEAFRDDIALFHQEFTHAMKKLSNFNVTGSPNGNIRVHCSRID